MIRKLLPTVYHTIGFALLSSCGCDPDIAGDGTPWGFDDQVCEGDCPAVGDEPDGGGEPGQPPLGRPDREPPDCTRTPAPLTRLSAEGVDVVRFAMAVGPLGCPHLVFADESLEYAHWNGERWTAETIRATSGWEASVFVDGRGVVTVYAEHRDRPGLAVLQRARGDWVEQADTGDRWIWGLQSIDDGLVLASTATQQHTGSDLAMHIVGRQTDQWRWTRIVDFQVTNSTPQLLARHADGRASLAVFENKGFGPNDPDSNLWIATSTDDSLSSWSAERLQLGPFNDFRAAHLYQTPRGVEMLAWAERWPREGGREMLHAVRIDREWSFDPFAECPPERCTVTTSGVDPRGRIWIVRTSDGAADTELGVFDDGEWTFRALDRLPGLPRFIAFSPDAQVVHLAMRTTDGDRALWYATSPPR